MKAVVFACLGMLLMTVDLGAGHGDLRGSNNELLDRTNQLARVRREAGWERIYTIFRYQDTTVTLTCGRPNTQIGVISALYGVPSPRAAYSCHWDVSARVDAECFGKRTCIIPVSHKFFGGRPCPFYYGERQMKLTFKCWPKEAKRAILQVAVASEHNDILLDCKGDTRIDVVSADYFFRRCRNDVISTVDNLCFGKKRCEFAATNAVLGHKCFASVKSLLVNYRCWPKEAQPGRLQVVHANEGDVLTFPCPPNMYTGVISAIYTGIGCQDCDVRIQVDNQCRWKQTCRLPVTNDIFGDACPYKKKYLDMIYRCFPKELLN